MSGRLLRVERLFYRQSFNHPKMVSVQYPQYVSIKKEPLKRGSFKGFSSKSPYFTLTLLTKISADSSPKKRNTQNEKQSSDHLEIDGVSTGFCQFPFVIVAEYPVSKIGRSR